MNKKNILSIILMIICAACISIGQLIWKLSPGYNLFYLVGGFLVYCLGAILMIIAYRNGELSILQPINSLNLVFAAIFAVSILKEELPVINIIGIILIISGVIVIGRSNK